MFTWRFFRQIATTDLVNFLSRPSAPTGSEKSNPYLFEGDPEEQAKKLYNNKEGGFRCKVIKDREPPNPQELEVPASSNETNHHDAHFN